MKLRIVTILLIVCNLNYALWAQNRPKADSLKKLLVISQCDSDRFNLLLNLSKFDEPLEGLTYAKEALEIATGENLKKKQALAFEHLSICQRKLGNYPEAIKASFEALRIYDGLGLEKKTASLLLQIGSHFTNDKNYTSATQYIKQALTIFRKRHDIANTTFALINLGETYRLLEKYDSASYCLNECLQLNQHLKHSKKELIQGYALGNLGLVHIKLNQIDMAKQELINSISILDKLGDLYSISVYQSQLAKIYIDEGRTVSGEQLLLASLNMAEKGTLKEQIRDISNDLSLFYEKQHRFDKSLFYRKKYEVYHDSLVNINNVRKVEQLHSQYWLDKKEASIQFLKKEDNNKRKLLLILSSGTILLITLLIFLQLAYRQRKKAFKRVSEQNVIIEKREREKAVLLRELNHRVKNNLQMVASLINIQARQSTEPALSSALEATRHRIDTLILIHQKLYRDNEDMQVNLKSYIGELVDNLIYSFGEKVSISMNLAPVYLHIDWVIPLGLIINELITNTLKYAKPEDKPLELIVELSEENKKVYLNIADNGNGLPEGFEKSNGFGLKLVHSLTKQLKGEISYSYNQGCLWRITLNLENYQKN
ncbi:MAG: tetratricopeptide repeat protein [Bacteroidales bacterium]|nr:tetratricopeptide repeat protein [Bacteroidales bacterium]